MLELLEFMNNNINQKKVEVVVMDSYPEPSRCCNNVNNRCRAITTI